MPAVPAIIMGGAAIGSSLIGKKAAENSAEAASKRSPEEMALFKAQTGLANQEQAQGQQLFGTAMPAIQNTLRYYQTLLGGNRTARMGAVSGEAQDTAAAYSGANKALSRSGLRGGELVAQKAENERAKAGQIARLVTGVRPQAAAATAGQAQGLLGASSGFNAGAGNIFAGLLGNSTGNRLQGNAVGREAGSALTGQLGKLFANIMGSTRGKWWDKGGGGGGGSIGGWGSGESSPEMG